MNKFKYQSTQAAIVEGLFDYQDAQVAAVIDLEERYVADDWFTYEEGREDDWLAYEDHAPTTTTDDDDDLDGADWCAWLTVPAAQFFDAVGDAWVIEGAKPPQSSVRASGYVRVHELASRIGIETKHMVEYLRAGGEYVASGSAYVAKPTAEAIAEVGSALVDRYGEVAGHSDRMALAALRARLSA